MIIDGHAEPLGAFPHLRRAGDFLFVSGVSSRRPDGSIGGTVVEGGGSVRADVRAQTREVLQNIESLLSAAQGGLADLVSLTIYLVDMVAFPQYNEEYGKIFTAATAPARTTVAVRELPHPHVAIEISCIAYLPERARGS